MLVDQKVKANWHVSNKKHYIEKGYVFTKLRDSFIVDVFDLPHSSKTKVRYICDFCKGENQIEEKEKWKEYGNLLVQRKDDKDCCKKCKGKKISQLFYSKPIPLEKSLAYNRPELVKDWCDSNENSPYEYSEFSNQFANWKCKKGHKWESKIVNRTKLLRGCPYCSHTRVSPETCLANQKSELIKEWHPSKNNELTPYDVTAFSKTKVWWKCLECSHEWNTTVSLRSTGSGCPICRSSKGERKIAKWLMKKKISYIPQKEFDGLVGIKGNPLSFDFYINDYNLLIEYQGEFHDGSTGWYSKLNLINQQEHDKRKKNYAKLNKINLLEIWYWELDNIEAILEEELEKWRKSR